MKLSLRTILAALLVLFIQQNAVSQITCTSGANLFVYANYDGGVLNIDVDVNIPNIKIGICTYEPVTINISGAYVGNVTEVRYAGYVSTNNFHCSNSPATTTITGVPSGITSVNFLPSSTLSNPNGSNSIVCAYSCTTNSSQGGCNTADQIKDYFQQSTSGVLTSYFTQYGCWSTAPYALSTGGNCCSAVLPCNMTASAGADQQMCSGASVPLTGSGTGGVANYAWTPTSGLSSPNAATTVASPSVTTSYILTVSDSSGACSAQDTVVVTVNQPQASMGPLQPVCGDAQAFQLYSGMPSGGTYSGPSVSNGYFSPAASGSGTFTITYTVVDSNGCTGTASAPLLIRQRPQVTVAPIGPFCGNDPAFTLTNGLPLGGTYSGPAISNGIFDPGLLAGSGTTPVMYNVVDSFGCVGQGATPVQVFANPNAPILSFVAPDLTTTSTGDSIQWFLNGSYLQTSGSSITPTLAGNYTAILWENGCPSDTSMGIVFTPVAIENGDLNAFVKAWPNPVNDRLYVEAKGLQFQVSFNDALGRMIRGTVEIDEAGSIDLQGLSSGLYILKISSKEQTISIRVLKK